jgi:hypothetical protein
VKSFFGVVVVFYVAIAAVSVLLCIAGYYLSFELMGFYAQKFVSLYSISHGFSLGAWPWFAWEFMVVLAVLFVIVVLIIGGSLKQSIGYGFIAFWANWWGMLVIPAAGLIVFYFVSIYSFKVLKWTLFWPVLWVGLFFRGARETTSL